MDDGSRHVGQRLAVQLDDGAMNSTLSGAVMVETLRLAKIAVKEDIRAKGLRLKDYEGVETTSEGAEPSRYVVVLPAAQPPVRDSGPGEGVRGNREVPPGLE